MAKQTKEQPEAAAPVVVEIVPGAASNGFVKKYDGSIVQRPIQDVIDEVVASEPEDRTQRSLLGLVKAEYQAGSVVTVNGKKIDLSESVAKYLVDKKTPKGNDYKLLRITVLKPQEGGLDYVVSSAYR